MKPITFKASVGKFDFFFFFVESNDNLIKTADYLKEKKVDLI
jgi:hypothetical protein